MQAATGSGSTLIGQQPEGSTVASLGDLFLGTVMLRGQDCFSVPCVSSGVSVASVNNINKSIYQAQNLVRRGSKRVHAHKYTLSQAPPHTSILTIQSLIYTQLKTGSKQRL